MSKCVSFSPCYSHFPHMNNFIKFLNEKNYKIFIYVRWYIGSTHAINDANYRVNKKKTQPPPTMWTTVTTIKNNESKIGHNMVWSTFCCVHMKLNAIIRCRLFSQHTFQVFFVHTRWKIWSLFSLYVLKFFFSTGFFGIFAHFTKWKTWNSSTCSISLMLRPQ